MKNENNISILSKSECCGCRACGETCPKNCISFSIDNEGFFYPIVDESICISCKKCQSVCPEIIQEFHFRKDIAIAAYCKNQQQRDLGSSGGVFGLLASEVIQQGGRVWGAAFDDNLRLVHKCATSSTELIPIYKSKYIQSDTSGIFNIIKKDIKDGILTLFSGTPCQCNAVRNYIGDCDNLITIEVVCHGVPSQSLFDKTIEWVEKKEKCKIISFTFRSKYTRALHPHSYTYICESENKKRTVNGLHYQFPFYFGFQKYITLRMSCYNCKWAKPQRTADITLGDFWGIEKYDPGLDPKKGVSMVILNTGKGEALFSKINEKQSILTKEVPMAVAEQGNGCLCSPTKMKPERNEFFDELQNKPFETVVKKFLVPRRKWIFDIYYSIPSPLRNIVRRVMDKRMKYE